MSDQTSASMLSSKINREFLSAPHRIALMTIWLVTAVVLVIMLVNGVRYTDEFESLRTLLQVAYVAALLWYLVREGPSLGRLPEPESAVLPRWRWYGRWLAVVLILFLLLLMLISDDGLGLLLLLLMFSTVVILIARRREIRWRQVWQGLLLAVIALLAGFPAMRNGFISDTVFFGFLIFLAPMYIAGGLLVHRTGLGGIELLSGQYLKALQSFLWGCLLFVPLGLINALEGSPGTDIDWVTGWWMPFSLPWYSGLAEEVLFRLLLVGLCYTLLRPALRKYPAVAVIAAVLFSAIIFGLGHGRTLERLLTTGLLYGLPMAVIFVRRNWEHAAGAHYMINLIPWVMVFLEI